MNFSKLIGTAGAILFVGSTAFAQVGEQKTVRGCLMQEAEYRKTHDRGKGWLGGAGLGDEFVLVEGTCGGTTNGKAYRLTGKPENDLKPFVGHRIEVTGRWDKAHDAKTAAGEKNASMPPEFRIASFHEYRDVAAADNASTTNSAPSKERTVAANETNADRRLPHTASNLPLVGLIGAISLLLFVGLRVAPSKA